MPVRGDDPPRQERAAEGPADRAALARLPRGRARLLASRPPSRSARGGRPRSPRSARCARRHAAPAGASSSTSAPGSRGRQDVRVEVQIQAVCVRGTRVELRHRRSCCSGSLLLPLLVLGYRWLQRRPTTLRRALHEPRRAGRRSSTSTRSWRRHAGLALFLLALAALLVGFARPSVNRLADREEATIVLVIDVSGSMQAKDVEPTRLAAAQKVVREFMKGLPKRFRVGVVAFSETAEVAAPATEDRQLAIDAIDYLYAQRGTAIGDGLARGVEVAREPSRRTGRAAERDGAAPAAILLLSDGSQTEGRAAAARGRRASEVLQDPGLHDRARHARGRRRVHPLRRHADHPGAARRADAAADRRDDGRQVLQGRERRRPARRPTRRWGRS